MKINDDDDSTKGWINYAKNTDDHLHCLASAAVVFALNYGFEMERVWPFQTLRNGVCDGSEYGCPV